MASLELFYSRPMTKLWWGCMFRHSHALTLFATYFNSRQLTIKTRHSLLCIFPFILRSKYSVSVNPSQPWQIRIRKKD